MVDKDVGRGRLISLAALPDVLNAHGGSEPQHLHKRLRVEHCTAVLGPRYNLMGSLWISHDAQLSGKARDAALRAGVLCKP